MSYIRFNDSDEEYQPSDSEDLSDTDKALLEKAKNKRKDLSDSEEEIYGVNSDSDQSDIALSDIEGQGEDDDDIPDVKAWGKNKRNYYATDYVDPDYGGFQGKDASLAELEEEEARKLQQQLTKHLDDDDFSLGFLGKAKEPEEGVPEEVIKTDPTQLSKRHKLQLLEKDSPEFFGLIEDYKNKMTSVQNFIYPTIKLIKADKISACQATDFVQTYYELILNYSTNIYMYLLLKSTKSNVQSHPIIKRLYQFRQLLGQMDPIFEETVKPQIKLLLSRKYPEKTKRKPTKKKVLKLLSKLNNEIENKGSGDNNKDPEESEIKPKLKRVKVEEFPKKSVQFQSTSEDDSENEMKVAEQVDKAEEGGLLQGELEKRGITYQIAKNKGLTPHRKKEQRNPRVKHRNKFRKAKIRRKGAVREVRTEMSRYGGEISGIKSSVTKSIKIKT